MADGDAAKGRDEERPAVAEAVVGSGTVANAGAEKRTAAVARGGL